MTEDGDDEGDERTEKGDEEGVRGQVSVERAEEGDGVDRGQGREMRMVVRRNRR